MALQNILIEIEELKRELDGCYPIPIDRLQKINYKLRLEWNYHSNKMEGGTLTFEETRSVMMAQLEIRGKPLRDVMEMHGHDETIKKIQKIGQNDMRLTENRIKEIHKAIIFDEENTPGRFKKRNNYIYNYLGERFDFTPEDATIEAMNTLSNWLDNELTAHKKGKSQKTIPEIAFEYHLRFLTIHPFLDGNGRTGRILMNLILIANNFPPVIIRTEEKDVYSKYIAHAQQYEENPIPLYEMLGNLLIRSLKICLKGAKGENIFELEDWEKRLQLLEYQSLSKDNILTKTNNVVYTTILNSVVPLVDYAQMKFSAFDRLFQNNSKDTKIKFIHESPRHVSYLISDIEKDNNENNLGVLEEININYEWRDFKIFGKNVEDVQILLQILFKTEGIEIKRLGFGTSTLIIGKKYSDILTHEEITNIINGIGNEITDEIENKLRKA